MENEQIASMCLEGNTESSAQNFEGKKKNWCFTSFEKTKPEFSEKMRYLCFSPEVCPTTLRPHWQGYFYLKNDMTLSAIKKKINHSWKLIMCNGSPAQNRVYCGADRYEKDGKIKERNPLFEEFGTLPSQGARTDLIALRDEIVKGKKVAKILIEDPHTFHQYGRTLERLEDEINRSIVRTKMPVVKWYWGPTGVGKSHRAYNNWNSDEMYELNVNDGGFWEDYRGEKKVIINEFRGEMPFNVLLQVCDKWPFKCKRKGRIPRQLLAEEIVITSCHHPADIYKHSLNDDEKIDQLLRRIEIIKLTEKYEEKIE